VIPALALFCILRQIKNHPFAITQKGDFRCILGGFVSQTDVATQKSIFKNRNFFDYKTNYFVAKHQFLRTILLFPVVPDILNVVVCFHDFQHLLHVLDVVLVGQSSVGLGNHLDLGLQELQALGLQSFLDGVEIIGIGVDLEDVLVLQLVLKYISESRFLRMFFIVKNEHLA
jgi:hypothetical protein